MTISDEPILATPPTGGAAAALRRTNADYAELRALVQERGLFERRLNRAIGQMALTFGLLATALAALWLLRDSWWALLVAVALGIVSTQIGLLGHDAGHRQVLRSGRGSGLLGLIFGNLLLGISRDWWVDKHNRHHSHSNEADNDPDIDVPLLAFSEEDARSKRGFARWCVRYQHILLFPMMLVLPVTMRLDSVKFILSGQSRQPVREGVALVAHFLLYGLLVFSLLPLGLGLAFIFVHQLLFGVYMGSIFAPNHKGMPLWESDQPPDFLRQQVITSRNVRGGTLVDFWYGGLNYQIEHHLFPTMPRQRLGEAQPIVRAFCQARGISYYETGVFQSYREILEFMHQVSAPVRTPAEA